MRVEPHRERSIFVRSMAASGNCDGRYVVRIGEASDSGKELVTVHVWHRDVEQENVRFPLVENAQGLARALRGSHRGALVGHHVCNKFEAIRIVVRGENRDSFKQSRHDPCGTVASTQRQISMSRPSS